MPTHKDAIAMLKEDHARVKPMLKELTSSDDYDRDLFDDIRKELELHTKLEEEIFYPAFKEMVPQGEGQELYFEAQEEHHVVDHIISKMKSEGDDYVFGAQAKLLREMVEHHASEEEKVMFPLARKIMGKDMLLDIAMKMRDRKEELTTQRPGLFAGLRSE
jgi:iron-sulfur cluster repair protein YtfE (RIC family)